MHSSHGGPSVRTYALTRRQRLRFAIGTPVRAAGFLAFVAALSWLGYVSIGASAVLVIAAFVVVVHWLPYVFAGRHRLVVGPDHLIDHVRFRTRSYAWTDIASVRTVPLPGAGFGIVMHLTGHEAFLRSSWRPDRAGADELVAAIHDAGAVQVD